MRFFMMLVVQCCWLVTVSAAQAPGTIAGRVTSTEADRPLAGAVIVVAGQRSRITTDDEGRYRITGVAAGSRTVEISRLGYRPSSVTIEVVAGATTTADVQLARIPQELAGLTVIGSVADLDEAKAQLAAVPGGVDFISASEIRSTRQATLKDVLEFTPGVMVQPRFGAADESQLSIRGSGLRNNFHARGINLLVNGMPYRNADGFTDFESLELLTAEAIEVYKGANAFRLGGSTLGGAINIHTKTGYTARPFAAFAQGGAFGFVKAQVESGHQSGAFDYYASYARTSLDGYRTWSEQGRDRFNLHLGYRLGATSDARAFYFYAKVAEQLPGALTRTEFEAAPLSANQTNVANRWGRDYDLHHVGVQLRTQLSPTQRLEVSPYLQYRDIDHPIFEVINQQSTDVGAEVRYVNTASLGSRGNRLTIGFQPAHLTMHNRQFANDLGEHGALTRDERDRVTSLAVYAENALSLTPRFTATVGIRLDHSVRKASDAFLSNGDQSDRRTYQPVTPRFGIHYQLPSGAALFANASRTVEPPLLLEMASFGNPGGFIDLKAQRAWQFEVGARGQRAGFNWELSLYDIELSDEILNVNVQPFPNAPFTVPTYRNAPKTRHAGVEAGAAYQLPGGVFRRGDAPDRVTLQASYTLGRFSYVDDPAYAGKKIPGAPVHHLVAAATYQHPSGFRLRPSVEWVPQDYFVNSANTETNGAWATLGLRAEWLFVTAGVTAFLEGRNLTDRRYSASVQVDNAAGRFFEPADRRSLVGGLRWTP